MSASSLNSKFRQANIKSLIRSITTAINGFNITASGSGYSNTASFASFGVDNSDTDPLVLPVITNGSGSVTNFVLPVTGVPKKAAYNFIAASGTGAPGALAVTPITSNEFYYAYIGNPIPYENENVPPPNSENDYEGQSFQWDGMMTGYRITENDVAFMTRLIIWESGVVYAQYDNADTLISEKDFYVLSSNDRVFKCINNNNGLPSTVEPTLADTQGFPPELADGYAWKYLYTVTGEMRTKFMVTKYMPVVQNDTVAANAIPGAIFNVVIESAGTAYPNDEGTVQSVAGMTVQVSSAASNQSNYYVGSTLTVIGNANQVTNFPIVESYAQGTKRYVVIATTVVAQDTNILAAGYHYYIGPTPTVLGNGSGTGSTNPLGEASTFYCYFKMNPLTGSIASVEIADPGKNYDFCTLTATAGNAFGSGASLRPVLSPFGGHGSDVYSELFCKHAEITATLPALSSSSLPTMEARSVGLIQSPTKIDFPTTRFSNTSFNQCTKLVISGSSVSPFTVGENIAGATSNARGYVGFANSTVTVLTGVNGTFSPGEVLTGSNSAVQFTLTSIAINPQLRFNSGKVLYSQNIRKVERSATAEEQLKLVIRF